MATLLDDDARIERTVVDIADKDVDDRGTKLAENGFQQVVRHWALWLVALECERDRIGFKRANPDRKVAPAIGFAEDDDTMLRQRAHANAVNSYTDHLSTFRREARRRWLVRLSADIDAGCLAAMYSMLKCAMYSNTWQKDTSRLSRSDLFDKMRAPYYLCDTTDAFSTMVI